MGDKLSIMLLSVMKMAYYSIDFEDFEEKAKDENDENVYFM